MTAFRLCLLFLIAFAGSPSRAENRQALTIGVHEVVVDGVRLWYRVAGRSSGIPVLFLHGGPGEGSQSFALLAGPALEPSLRMIYLDERGSGRSERPWNNAYSFDLLVEDVEQLRRLWGVPRIALIGHSVGTIIAMEYGAKYPQHVDHMVLAAAGPDIPGTFNIQCDRLQRSNPTVYARARAAVREGSARTCNVYDGAFEGPGLQEFVNSNMFPDPAIGQRVAQADTQGGLRNGGELGRALMQQGLLEYRFRQASRLTMPVLIIAGAEDHQANIEPQRAFAATLPHGRMLEYAGRGHFMFVEDPQRFARDVVAFLRER